MIYVKMRHDDMANITRRISEVRNLIHRSLLRQTEITGESLENPHSSGWLNVVLGTYTCIDQD